MANVFGKIFKSYSERQIDKLRPIAEAVLALDEEYGGLSDEALKAKTVEFKERIANGATLDDLLPEAFAAVREASGRVLGMRHFPVQILGGIVLHQGRISEMKTGEGKTLVATLPAYLNALGGGGVHIVTVNDYLAKRDSEWMGKVYRYLGLDVGLVISQMEPFAKHTAYAADITYATNNELGFDYLRDNMVVDKSQIVQRSRNFAILDEVDSILIDEARTPLIISGQGEESTELYEMADRLARGMTPIKFATLDDKEHTDDLEADYVVDEKANTVALTARGIKKAESHFNIENLSAPENMTVSHHVNQAIRARGVMHRDKQYVVKDGEVLIVDEFTGRLMIGRRYSDGLHQAIEAKEGVKVEHENKTLATITFQNFFRLYKKLSGMTGTAKTEEEEFRGIYELDVVEVPTNRPMIRKDNADLVYRNSKVKFTAIANEIEAVHKTGQPILVGTITIDKSEELSGILKRRGIKHEVLNAKYHEREAQIIAQAGKKGAVTIATNMAGRGTDIMLGGNAEYMAKNEMARQGFSEELISEASGFGETADEEIIRARALYSELYEKYKAQIAPERDEVVACGGLYILGTERHESRRIDNQLRGRSGRQGDPGTSRFYIALDDDLMRIFGGERMEALVGGAMGDDEDSPLENRMLSKAIESAQRKVEGRNYNTRKYVLQYDDVMNQQREIIYSQRQKVLDGENLRDAIINMVGELIEGSVRSYVSGGDPYEWNLAGLKDYMESIFPAGNILAYPPKTLEDLTPEKIAEDLKESAMRRYAQQEEAFGEERMRALERMQMLVSVDRHWMNHIDDMQELKRGITLRAYGQHNPVEEYKFEGFEMFEAMIDSIRETTVRGIMTYSPQIEIKRVQRAVPLVASHGDGSVEKKPVQRKTQKVGRNDPCPCGSGLKYKKCCGKNEE